MFHPTLFRYNKYIVAEDVEDIKDTVNALEAITKSNTTQIKELRIEKRITQLQLSIYLNVTQETISAYEHDKHLPSLTALMKMSELFDASMDYIMGLSPVRQIKTADYTIDDEQRDFLVHCYRQLGSKNKAQLVAYAQGLLDSQKN